MARIAGVYIPTGKKIGIALTYIYGIGKTTSHKICVMAGVSEDKRVHQLSDDEVMKLREAIASDCKVEGDLRKDVAMSIKTLIDMKCYRGMRHVRRLPVRGQRTHTNARTRKGKAVAIAGKKKVTK